MRNIAIEKARRSDEPLLQNLLQLYTHDFSEFWAGSDRGELDRHGRFSEYPLDPYWNEAGHVAFLIRADDKLAGFCLVNDHGRSEYSADASVAEFFVLRKYRGNGVGMAAAQKMLGYRAGIWEVAVARKNLAALRFWRRVVAECSAVQDVEERDIATSRWDGPVFRFRVDP